MTPALTILDAIGSRHLFQQWFRKPTWAPWIAFLGVLFGLPLTREQRAFYRQCTGRATLRSGGHQEAWLVCGRRAGKSFVLAVVAVFLACFRDWSPYLAEGERGTIIIVATDRKQARTIFRYVKALLARVPLLAQLIQRQSDEAMDLSNGITIEVMTASFRALRGYTVIAALLDEVAFWRSDEASANPDAEILNALRPAMATVPGAMLLCASSPYARRGELYRMFRKFYGQDAPVLVWKAPTRTMNPSVPQSLIDDAYERDPAWASAEYGAEFRSDIESYISRETLDQIIVAGRLELPPVSSLLYAAFVDPSGGSGDSMTLAIAHREAATGKAIIDALREVRPPFSPEAVVQEFAALLGTYRVASVEGDRYAGEWPRERFREHGIRYEPAAKVKSDLYRDLLPIINSRQAELPDHPRLTMQLTGLERRTARGGRDSIDHSPGGHDDLANVVAGALLAVNGSSVWSRPWAITRDHPFPLGINGSAIRHAQERSARRHVLRFR